MIFYIYDYFSEKFNNTEIRNRKKPNKLKYIIIWLILIIIVNIIFYFLGLFDGAAVKASNLNKILVKPKSTPKIIPKNNTFRNTINYDRIDKKVYDIVPKENVEAIESILNEVKNIPVPQNIKMDEYNFE